MEDGDRGTFQPFEKTVHLRDRLEGAGEDEAGNPRVGGRCIGSERSDQISERSPGVITRLPSSRWSRKWGSSMAATLK